MSIALPLGISTLVQPLVIVPMGVLVLLVSLIWLKGSVGKSKDCFFWLVSYGLLCAGLLSVAYIQKQSGCDLYLGDCYSDSLPEGFWVMKLTAMVAYYFWTISAGLAFVRRIVGVSDKAAKKGAIALLATVVVVSIGFVVYLRSFAE